MPVKIVELENIGTLHLYKRRASRSIRLSFGSKGEIRLSLPYWAPYQSAINFARSRSDWILKHRPKEATHQYENAQKIGKAHRLALTADNQVISTQVRLIGTSVTVKYPVAMSASSAKVQEAAERGAKKALKKEAEALLPQKLKILASRYGFRFRGVEVKQLKSKWGSCNQNHDITLNYYLMQLPWRLIDYVLVHELVHTEHLNHSDDFWKRFESILPGAKKVRKELKEYKTIVMPTSV